MQTRLTESILSTDAGREADAILRRCVHCGFCNATCPTYQVLGDELDGPRGRIYLIKQFLEGEAKGEVASYHLDRCLSCRNCETTCPSGVQYGHLLDIGREQIEGHISRPFPERLLRSLLKTTLSSPFALRLGIRLGSFFKWLLPPTLQQALPQNHGSSAGRNASWPKTRHSRRVILLQGCVQRVMDPAINAATAQVLDRLSISALKVKSEGCCGALHQHLTAAEKARHHMRRNIDLWWPYIDEGIEAIVSTASACGLQIKEYGYYLRNDVRYAEKARQVSALARDAAEVIDGEAPLVANSSFRRVAFHAPCTLQHGQQLNGLVEDILEKWGFEALPVTDSHLCCGSAGTYSILKPELARKLRENKITALMANEPEVIASANIGCIEHLRKTAAVPVRHWIELLAEGL